MNQLTHSTIGNLDGYIRFTKSIPLLTEDEEFTLFEQLKKQKNLEAAQKLIYAHLRLVVKIARDHINYGLPLADLIQEGNVGLMKAVKAFDPDKQVRLFSYAVYWIKAEIQEFIVKNWRMVKIATTKVHRKLFFNLRKLRESVGTLGVTETESIAKQLELKPSDVTEFEAKLNGKEMPLLAEDDESAPIDWLHDVSMEPTKVIERQQKEWFMTEGIKQGLDKLDPRSREIIQSRWLDDETKTLQDLASVYNVSLERIRQIEVKALKQLKVILSEVKCLN